MATIVSERKWQKKKEREERIRAEKLNNANKRGITDRDKNIGKKRLAIMFGVIIACAAFVFYNFN